MDVSRTFKGKRIAYTSWVFMMFGIIPQLLDKLILSSLAMSKLVRGTWRRRNKVSKIRVEGIIDKGDKNVWAQARGEVCVRCVRLGRTGKGL